MLDLKIYGGDGRREIQPGPSKCFCGTHWRRWDDVLPQGHRMDAPCDRFCQCGQTLSQRGVPLPVFHRFAPYQCNLEGKRQSEERKERRHDREDELCAPITREERKKWETVADEVMRVRNEVGGDCFNIGDIVCHVRLPDDSLPPSEWEETPIGLNPDQARMSVIMKHVRRRKASAQKRYVDSLVRRRERNWDW